jgi:hypothetical protein
MREWTGADGDKGATKDPIDCLRYLAVMCPQYDGENKEILQQKGFSY